MTTTEKNKIIAVFMGLSYCEKYQFEGWYKNHEHNERVYELNYDIDWNWLMEVVEKIFSTVDEKREDDSDWDYLTKVIRDSFYFPQKENVYNCCLDFIIWYNEQNSTK